jgi:hypothetical protein
LSYRSEDYPRLGDASQADHVLLAGRVVAEGPPADALTPALLNDTHAHCIGVMEVQVMVVDPAHKPSGRRHIHGERSKLTGGQLSHSPEKR